ncbi:MAG: DUF5777 family beta-barrel protein [Mangrovibacterium sp.]
MKTLIFIIVACFGSAPVMAQVNLEQLFEDSVAGTESLPVLETFKSPRLINSQSNETIHKHDLLFVVMHRFGDFAGKNGGTKTFFGLDNSTDILIGFDYGISDDLNIGIGRAKGAPNGVSTDQAQIYYFKSKYRMLRQTNQGMPFSLTLFGNAAVSGMKKRDLVTSDAAFSDFGDRMSFVAQTILTRKFSEDLSLALLPTYVRRNYVTFMDKNNMFALGIGGRVKVSKWMAVVADYFIAFRDQDTKDYFLQEKDFRFYNPLGVGLEIETGGHVFNLSFTNSTAILENQFIPGTSSSWTKGGFRWGFSITRTFSLFNKSTE